MKLSRLVDYLNHLEQYDVSQAAEAMTQHLDPVIHAVSSHDLQFSHINTRLTAVRMSIQKSLGDTTLILGDLMAELKTSIEALEPHYLRESYRLYSENMINDTDDHILQRRPQLEPAAENYLRGRLLRYGDWHYPGMIIRPGVESWIQDLVALDPLYLIDKNHDLLAPALARFPTEYQNRLRCYTVRTHADPPFLADLPRGQMGLVLAYNYFNFVPLEMIRHWLQEIFHCLRPGGVVAFTFNNCDRAGGVDLAERYFMCYTPARLVLSAADMLGYEMVHAYHIDAAATWIELKRPGVLHNLRGGQALAKIVAKSLKK